MTGFENMEAVELTPEQLEQVSGGWGLKDIWRKVKGWIDRVDEDKSQD